MPIRIEQLHRGPKGTVRSGSDTRLYGSLRVGLRNVNAIETSQQTLDECRRTATTARQFELEPDCQPLKRLLNRPLVSIELLCLGLGRRDDGLCRRARRRIRCGPCTRGNGVGFATTTQSVGMGEATGAPDGAADQQRAPAHYSTNRAW